MSGPEISLWLRVFLVKLSHETTVDELKKAIKEACSVKFRQIFAHTLDLYKVSIPLADIDKKLEHIQDPKDIASAVKLQPLDDLSNVFRDPPAHNHVHIIVQSPITKFPRPPPSFGDTSYRRPDIPPADLATPRLPVWEPPMTVDEETKEFYRHLEIPAGIKDRPNLLLHDIGKDSNPFIGHLFRGGEHRILCNTSGAGKTRLLFEGLCRHWGFYFVAAQDTDGIGAIDLQHVIERMRFDLRSYYTSHRNREIAFYLLYKVLLARWVVFRTFIEVAREKNSGTLPSTIKRDWLIFQVFPVFAIRDEPFYAIINECLVRASMRFSPSAILGPAFDPKHDTFFYVLDEAQVAGHLHMGKFADESGATPLPVLHPIVRVGKDLVTWDVVHTTGDFANQERQNSYVTRYLPPTFLHSESGAALLRRMFEWLRGRHRFTARFLEDLIGGAWNTTCPKSPHKLLDAFVHSLTTFTPTDGDRALLETEPGVRWPSVQSFPWDNLSRGSYPVWYSERWELVELGLGRFVLGEGSDHWCITVDEPIALMSTLRYFKAEGYTLDDGDRVRMQCAEGQAFEEAVLSGQWRRPPVALPPFLNERFLYYHHNTRSSFAAR
ncbi:hypothetical protein BGW80DRAFT_1324650 [Lactifluus volemus]|nr:hypothetical protein BGW80DRAFT_1324650 [Lactifluus volemus]